MCVIYFSLGRSKSIKTLHLPDNNRWILGRIKLGIPNSCVGAYTKSHFFSQWCFMTNWQKFAEYSNSYATSHPDSVSGPETQKKYILVNKKGQTLILPKILLIKCPKICKNWSLLYILLYYIENTSPKTLISEWDYRL